MTYGLALVGVLIGVWASDVWGAIVGGTMGALVGVVVDLRRRLAGLDRRLSELEAVSEQSPVAPSASASEPTVPSTDATVEIPEPSQPRSVPAASSTAPVTTDLPTPPDPTPRRPSPFAQAIAATREFLLGGNTVVRVGILVLLVGVTLLVKWAADHDYFPIELRMASAGLIGLVLVILGFRARRSRPGFAQTLQGGGIAAMYLVIFFSFRTYGLVPPSLAFVLLAAVAFFSGALAVLQDALPLLVIAEIGGFMAPVLASTGEGRHVALFSYYVVLNLAIFGVAWFKAWRLPNLLGFAFTFGVGSTWGALRYEPEQLWTTEPFLIIFFALYLAIPVLFAIKNPDEKQGWVDGTLVFGTPLATLALQHALVHDIRFGMAFSTLALAAVYIGVGRLLFKRAPKVLAALAEALLAIGVGFATLAVPYGFDNHNLTGATWALEGAGLYWVGVRQERWLSRWSGALLQILGGLALVWHATQSLGSEDALPFANTRFLAAFLLCGASLFVARQAHAYRDRLPQVEALGLQTLIAWGLMFWLTIGLAEVTREIPGTWVNGAILAFLGLTGFALELGGRRFRWLPGRYPGAVLISLLALLLLWWRLIVSAPFFEQGGLFGWTIYLGATTFILRRFVSDAPPWARMLHPMFLWFGTAFAALLVADVLSELAGLDGEWSYCIALATAAAIAGMTLRSSAGESWPFHTYRRVYQTLGLGVLLGMLLACSLFMNLLLRADTPPLSYLPILNPVDLAQLSVLIVSAAWVRRLSTLEGPAVRELRTVATIGVVTCTFVWFNGLLARSVHHFMDVPFSANNLWTSVPFQVAISVSWTLIGLAVTVWSSRGRLRVPWFLGATLLGLVVVKMFVVDLAQLSTPAKIGTFLVVGSLLLLVGYLSPVPPADPNPGPRGRRRSPEES